MNGLVNSYTMYADLAAKMPDDTQWAETMARIEADLRIFVATGKLPDDKGR